MSLDGHDATLEAWTRLRLLGVVPRPLADEEIEWHSWLGRSLLDAARKAHDHRLEDTFVECMAELEEHFEELLGLAGLYGLGIVRFPS